MWLTNLPAQHAHEYSGAGCRWVFPAVIGQLKGMWKWSGSETSRAVVAPEDMTRTAEMLALRDHSQTTQLIDFVREIVDLIRASYRCRGSITDTVQPTKDRQSALRKLIETAEAMVVVGGLNSNNTRQLVETCRAAGKAAFHIERPDELRADWFNGVRTVGLTAGTSTLRETVQAVHERLQDISRRSNPKQPET
jgi:4-hydroxy-3-methylbut-2-enyl diphosphate reductase